MSVRLCQVQLLKPEQFIAPAKFTAAAEYEGSAKFIAAAEYEGSKSGYVFATREEGTGYFHDQAESNRKVILLCSGSGQLIATLRL